jgi:indole-3-glycerol phosphate synthase
MDSILDQIINKKKIELERRKVDIPLSSLEEQIQGSKTILNLSGALMADEIRLIAEIKKASPSKGLLRSEFHPAQIALSYAESGAAAISVLTDQHFQGEISHLKAVSESVVPFGTPVLRKDFIIDPYQVFEARANGADAILLIVAALEQPNLRALLELAGNLWLQCLVEIHDEGELNRALEAGAEIIGINNRDLKSFQTDLSVTRLLAPKIPRGKIVVSESGISSHEDLVNLSQYGVHAVLVGEALMTAENPGNRVKDLLGRGKEID